MKQSNDNYFKVIAQKGEGAADILLYGFIGEVYDFWGDKDEEKSNTDADFARTLAELSEDYDRINVRINSPGGSMFHGNAIVSAMRRCKAEIHTYNDGLAASMAADIWMAGNVRHMNSNSLLMIHSPSSVVFGTAKQMRQEADVLDKFAQTTISIMAEATGMDPEEVKATYYEDYEDHWMTADEAVQAGLIEEVEKYTTEAMVQPERMSFRRLMKEFAKAGDEQAQAFLKELTNFPNRVTSAMQARTAALKVAPNTDEMTIDALKKGLQEGELDIEEVQAALATFQTPEKEATPEPTAAELIEKATQPLLDQITALSAQVEALKAAPAEQPAQAAAEADPASTESSPEAEYEKTMKEWNEAAKTTGNPWLGAK
jgi:ATP-dependent Clp endopeptidase proteolytic subunit ClpP